MEQDKSPISESITSAVQESGKALSSGFDTFRWILRIFISAIERFYWDNGFSKAASLAYTSLLSLVPVTFVGFGFLASLTVTNADLQKVREFIFRQFVPNQATVSMILEKLSEIDRTLNDPNFSVLAVAFFGLTALLLINSIEYALNEIWQVFEPRTIAQRLSIFCAILVIGPILVTSIYYTTKVRMEPFITGLGVSSDITTMANHVVSYVIDFAAFFLLYFLVPKAPVKVTASLFGAAITALFFDLAKLSFAVYIVRFTSYDKVYGALATVPIFLFWLYVSWTIILFGSELSYQFQYLPKIGKIWKRQVTSIGDGSLLLSLQALVMIVRAFEKGERIPSELDVAESLGCSSIVLRPILDSLKRRGIISETDSRDKQLSLQRSPERITLEQVAEAIYQGRGRTQFAPELARFFGCFADWGSIKDKTVKDLL